MRHLLCRFHTLACLLIKETLIPGLSRFGDRSYEYQAHSVGGNSDSRFVAIRRSLLQILGAIRRSLLRIPGGIRRSLLQILGGNSDSRFVAIQRSLLRIPGGIWRSLLRILGGIRRSLVQIPGAMLGSLIAYQFLENSPSVNLRELQQINDVPMLFNFQTFFKLTLIIPFLIENVSFL